MNDNDLWWHLRNGASIALRHAWPVTDTYSFTAAGAPWLDHSWLSELLFYNLYRVLELRGVLVAFAAAVAGIGVAVFRMCLRRNPDPLASGIAAIFGGSLAMVAFMPRAQVFGWLCFSIVFGILLRFRDNRRAPLWLIPPLFCLWINLHGSWPMGIAVFGIWIAAGCVRSDIGWLKAAPWKREELKKLLTVFAGSLAALFMNPFSYRLAAYPFNLAFIQKLAVRIGDEWASVNFNDSRGLYVLAMLALVFVLAATSRHTWFIDDAALGTFALYCGLTHVRFLILTGIVLPPILVRHFGKLSSYDPQQERRPLNAAVMLAAVAAIVFGFPSESYLNAQVKQAFPAGAVDHLRSHPLAGRMFNEYEWGGYLGWTLPDLPVFIDTRTDIFEYRGVLKDYVAISTLHDAEELLNKYAIAYVVYPPDTPLAYFLSKSPVWRCDYRDDQAVVYRRISSAPLR